MAEQAQSFRTPEEEIAYLREQIAQKEQALQEASGPYEQENVIKETISEYQDKPIEVALSGKMQMNEVALEHSAHITESLDHTDTMTQLIATLEEKGVKNTLAVVEKLHQPDVTDDFHKLLVQKIKEGLSTPNLKESDPMWNVLHMTLYEVSMPEDKAQSAPTFHELISAMEQFYSGMLTLAENKKKQHLSVEFAIADKSHEIVMYIAVPDEQCNLFEKQMQSLFPTIQLRVQTNDYNIFVEGGESVAAVLSTRERGIYPFKANRDYEHDPINVILNAFSKIETEGGGAAAQFIFSPVPDNALGKKFLNALEKIKKGTPIRDATNIAYTTKGEIAQSVGGFLGEFVKGSKSTDSSKDAPPDPLVIERISRKIETPIVAANIRFVTSATSAVRAKQILSELVASTKQFDDPQSNGLEAKEFSSGSKLGSLLKNYTFREFNPSAIVPLSLREFPLLAHVPVSGISSSPQFKEAKSSGAPAPLDLPQNGTLLGINHYRNVETKAFLTPKDRVRHLYVIGQTGTGKSVFLKNLVIQDIQNGDGVCYIDPHGTDIEDVLAAVPEDRIDDVIYFDPSASDGNVLGLNMLEYDPEKPEQKTFVINELFGIFKKLYSGDSMGPIFEQYFRNSTALVMEDPKTGNTLMDISRVLADSKYRALKLMRCKNPIVKQFWTEIASKAGGEGSLQNMVPYITSKFDVFTANDIMRPIIAQEKSAFNMRDVMDNRKILLVNLAKGRLGDINANLIGLILVGKILMAALSRVDSMGKDFPPMYLYIDEFQNITTDSIESILSEARKYKLSLNVAHQFIAQLEPGIRDAVFGNVGSMAVFRIGQEDAQFIENQFEGVFDMNSIMNIENYHAFVKILADGKPVKPFDIVVPPPFEGDLERGKRIKLYAANKYGYPRERVDKYIEIKYGSGDAKDKEASKPVPSAAAVAQRPSPTSQAAVPASSQPTISPAAPTPSQNPPQSSAEAATSVAQAPPATPAPTTPAPVAPPAEPPPAAQVAVGVAPKTPTSPTQAAESQPTPASDESSSPVALNTDLRMTQATEAPIVQPQSMAGNAPTAHDTGSMPPASPTQPQTPVHDSSTINASIDPAIPNQTIASPVTEPDAPAQSESDALIDTASKYGQENDPYREPI